MIVGFFVLDAPATTGDGTDLCIDNVEVTRVVTISPDLDGDGDVDQADLNLFESCASGPAIPHNGTDRCQDADFDSDGDVDQLDFSTFQRCCSGSGNTPDPDCQ